MNQVMLVDDSTLQRELQRQILEDSGMAKESIIEATNGQEAITLLAKNGDVKLIISDWNMPNMNGIDFVKQLRLRNIETPVIMVTSESDEERLVEAYEAGVNGFVLKPIREQDLLESVSSFLV